ncbi:hypothetical protein [Hyalangium sp.]|uniref:hypothetical protein n=1 Tax=Hyalangium sp. TaxID=2028555 RepID=UPI002D421124|nr:hypothetical protein [Hyalangium sp.]HYH95350.1 hypothetical protein [Hyalangium sp.]
MSPRSHVWGLGLAALAAVLCSCRPEVIREPRPPAEEASAALRYKVTYVREPEQALDVEVVRSNEAPRDFLFTQAGGVRTVQAYSDTGEVRVLQVEEGGVLVPSDTRSLRYRYSLNARTGRRWWDLYGGMTAEGALLIAGKSWLIRPRFAETRHQVELSVQGADVLLPWQPGPDGLYRLRTEDLVDSGFHAFGGRRYQVQLPDAVLDVAILAPMTHMEDARVCEWVRQRAEEVRQIRRTFPYPRVSVIVYPVPRRNDADLFGMVMWSSPPSVALLVGQDTPPDALTRDWMALHELLHLIHPAILPRTPWVSEGLATYFTEVARTRSGRQSPERLWRELLYGFNMGREQADGRTMQEMIDEDAPPGIYWVGAFFSLRLDVALRRATENQRGLTDVLELLAMQGSTATVESYGAAVDAVAGRPLFEALLAEDLRRPAFAALEGLLEDLGVMNTPGGVKLQPARDSQLREALDGKTPARSQ